MADEKKTTAPAPASAPASAKQTYVRMRVNYAGPDMALVEKQVYRIDGKLAQSLSEADYATILSPDEVAELSRREVKQPRVDKE